MTKETKNKSKIILPLAITGVLLIGGVGSCTAIKYNKTDESKDTKTEIVDNDNISGNNNDGNGNEDIKIEIDKEKDDKEDDVELNRDDEGNISFSKKEDESDDYAHLEDTVRDKAESDDDIYFTLDEDGNLIASNKNDDAGNDDLLASIDKDQIVVPSDKDSSNDNESDNDEEEKDDGNTGGGSDGDGNTGGGSDGDGNTGGGSDGDEKPDPVPIDKTNLNNIIQSALNYNADRYTTISWESFDYVLNRAIAINNSDKSTQNNVYQATDRLNKVIFGLEVKPPSIAVKGLEELEGKDNNITIHNKIDIKVDAKDVDGRTLNKTIELNGEVIDGNESGYQLHLQEGINKVEIKTTDNFGGKTTEEFEINYVKDLTPVIKHSLLTNDDVKDGVLTFETSAFDYKEDLLDVVVTHNDEEVEVEDGNVSIELTEGKHKIELSATDEKHEETKEIEIEFEYTADGFIEGDDVEYDNSSLEVDGLHEDLIVDGKIDFVVKATDGYGRLIPAEVVHNGNVIDGTDGLYTVELIEGENEFEISMTDQFGDLITEEFKIDYIEDIEDNNPNVEPDLKIDGLESDYITVTDKDFTFNAIATDGNGKDISVEVLLNSNLPINNVEGLFSIELEQGENNVYVTATDDFGNTIEKEFTINHSDESDDEIEDDQKVDKEEPPKEEVVEEVLVNGNIGNSNKEFDSLEEAYAWAKQEIIDTSSTWNEYEISQLDYHEIDSNNQKVEGTERSTWTVNFTEKKELPAEEVEEDEEEILVTQIDEIESIDKKAEVEE